MSRSEGSGPGAHLVCPVRHEGIDNEGESINGSEIIKEVIGMIPRVYVVEGVALGAWGGPSAFNLTFDEASTLIHDLQDAMINLRHLSNHVQLDFFILVVPKAIP